MNCVEHLNVSSEIIVLFEEATEREAAVEIITDRIYRSNLIMFDQVNHFLRLRQLWRQAQDLIFDNKGQNNINIMEIRKEINQFLTAYRDCIQSFKNIVHQKRFKTVIQENTMPFHHYLLPLTKLENSRLRKLVSSAARRPDNPVHHFVHLYFEIEWLLITLEYLADGNHLDELIMAFLKNLLMLPPQYYENSNRDDLLQFSPFPCKCFRRFWLVLQIFLEKVNKPFWEIFNQALDSPDDIFVIWIIYHVATIQGYSVSGNFVGPDNLRVLANYSQVEKRFESILTKSNADASQAFQLIEALLDEWWGKFARLELYQKLWESFNKRLNETDKELNHTPSKLIDLINGISTEKNSYNSFINLMKKFLVNHPNLWSKLRGRILCKLPQEKINGLNETGLFRIAVLLLSLGQVTDFFELADKLQSFLQDLPNQKKRTAVIWNIQIVIIILYLQKGWDIQNVSLEFLRMLSDVANNPDYFHLLRTYLDSLEIIFSANENFNLHQSVLFDQWMDKYLRQCSQSELRHFAGVLVTVLKKVQYSNLRAQWDSLFKTTLLPSLRRSSSSPSSPEEIGELAVVLSEFNHDLTTEIVTSFTNDFINPKVVVRFLIRVLERCPEKISRHEKVVIQAWVRCCLLNTNGVLTLTKLIFKLQVIVIEEFEMDPDPFCNFIKLLGSGKTKLSGKDICAVCFGRVSEWVGKYLNSSEETVLHIYTCMSLLFFHCAPLIYQQQLPYCPFNTLTMALFLPTDVQMGRSPNPNILKAVFKTFHLFLRGIVSLDYVDDLYLNRILRDLIMHYIPHLPINNSPILKCLHDDNIAPVVLDKIALGFLSHPFKSTEENIAKALKLVSISLETCDSLDNMKLIIEKLSSSLLEVIMFHPTNKNMAVDILKYLTTNVMFVHVREILRKAIIHITEKHLAFNSTNYFQLTIILIKIVPSDMRMLVGDIQQNIQKVEYRRGVGYDIALRAGLDRINAALSL